MHVMAFLILLLTGLIAYYLMQLAADVRAIREDSLRDVGKKLAAIEATLHQKTFVEGVFEWRREGTTGHHHSTPHKLGCFVVWEWRDGDWQPHGLAKGAEGCLPPNYPGAFPGDIARTWATLTPK
jgi:hypothetical protein